MTHVFSGGFKGGGGVGCVRTPFHAQMKRNILGIY